MKQMTVRDYGLNVIKAIKYDLPQNFDQLSVQEKFELIKDVHTEQHGSENANVQNGVYKKLIQSMTDNFLWLDSSTADIESSLFEYISQNFALMWLSNDATINIINTKFNKLLGMIQTSLIFSI